MSAVSRKRVTARCVAALKRFMLVAEKESIMKHVERTIAVWLLLILGIALWLEDQHGFAVISLLASETLAFGHNDGR